MAQKWAIYAGDGDYLASTARDAAGRMQFTRTKPRAYEREAAIAVLHQVRRDGRPAWIVPHPSEGDVCASARVGVAA